MDVLRYIEDDDNPFSIIYAWKHLRAQNALQRRFVADSCVFEYILQHIYVSLRIHIHTDTCAQRSPPPRCLLFLGGTPTCRQQLNCELYLKRTYRRDTIDTKTSRQSGYVCRRHEIGKLSSHMIGSVRTSTQLEYPSSGSRTHTSRVRETCFILACIIRKIVSLLEEVHITGRAVLYVPPPATTYICRTLQSNHTSCMQQVPSPLSPTRSRCWLWVFTQGRWCPRL